LAALLTAFIGSRGRPFRDPPASSLAPALNVRKELGMLLFFEDLVKYFSLFVKTILG